MKWFLVLGLLAIAAIGLWPAPQSTTAREIEDRATTGKATSAAVGTTGGHANVAEGPAIISEIETITGTNDGMALIGRRVDLHVDVQGLANDHAFWVGSPDNRLLVVLARDNSSHRMAPVHRGQRTAVSGVIKRIPDTEAIAAWKLTSTDRRELVDRKIYIRADSITTQSHGAM
jgi:hypothetical protein